MEGDAFRTQFNFLMEASDASNSLPLTSSPFITIMLIE